MIEQATAPLTSHDDDRRRAAIDALARAAMPSGGFEGEVVWNTMILAQVVIVRRVIQGEGAFSDAERAGMIRHFEVSRTPEGGFGLHPESGPYVFFTTLAYVALRLLGVGPDEPITQGARRWLREESEGVLAIPSWGKLWLSMLGLYGYEGVNPILPELFLLPDASGRVGVTAVHPNRYYCHVRYIYLAVSYLYGARFVADLGSLRGALRRELYDAPFEDIDFAKHRHSIAKTDLYVAPTPALRASYDALRAVERLLPGAVRQRALARAEERIVYEMRASRYQGISPVNGLLNCLALYAKSPHHPDLAPSLAGMEAWRWEDEREGIRYAGARSNSWDTAFALRAMVTLPPPLVPRAAAERAYRYLLSVQLTEELPGYEREARAPIAHGFCFSDGQHRWPVSDCTAEAISAMIGAEELGIVGAKDRISDERLWGAVRFLLDRRNEDGGFGTYEARRGGPFLDALNPSEMYGNCMTERSYVECTASCVVALSRVLAHRPPRDAKLRMAAERAVRDGARLLREKQRSDGAWAGFWGVNFTYAIFHAVEALSAAGAQPSDPAITRAAAFLLSKQKDDGGWGERYTGCLGDTYDEHPTSQVVMTSWALIALSHAPRTKEVNHAIARGKKLLLSRQRPDGTFPEESVEGVFFGTAMLRYRLYKAYFPVWALAEHR